MKSGCDNIRICSVRTINAVKPFGLGRFLICWNPAKGVSAICNLICLSLKNRLEVANFFCKGPSGKYFQFCRPCGRYHNYFQKQVASYIGSQTEVCQPLIYPGFSFYILPDYLSLLNVPGQWSIALYGAFLLHTV